MPDEVSVGEVYRLSQAIAKQVDHLAERFDSFTKDFVRADLHEMAVGSTRLEITRLDHGLKEVDSRLRELAGQHDQDIKAIREAADARFRQLVTGIACSFLGPVATGLILIYFSNKP